ncbi:phosphate acetyltransferase [Corynebacterium sp. MC-04]|uniref:Phosphate acetyltransferase n=2 Tax=Corynebacterium parakroppenstedtii TaxID=2828363 RepID=A0ABS9HIN2_9CORY|nr:MULTISPECIES: phosphate acetyltransferase [Corynebacterium]KXB50835.1 phosphate acetyltransferase [Corynebacterium kroppenstedtii]MBY0792407.1 phosphate acetyltransferase [Corynebacterium parakroppenstedtii]MBY0795836.1 phosphate acetyltransferase [Corynebacterium parakroppenstedtii]MCF6769358.1 phosphate acetyltransferase [Corynebacterium parakroppenstedtii]MCF6770782.1 phosphate acetyltransferase [Corynebacterium parakroppenstedtii]
MPCALYIDVGGAFGPSAGDALPALLQGNVTRIISGEPESPADPSALVAEAVEKTSQGKASEQKTSDEQQGALVATGDITVDSRIAASIGAPVVLLFLTDATPDPLRVSLGISTAEGEGATVAAVVTQDGQAIDGVPSSIPVIAASDQATLDSAVSSAVGESDHLDPVIGPEVFQHNLIDQARASGARIVLPEGDDDRILRAADWLLEHHVCDLTILGDPDDIAARSKELGLNLSDATIADPQGTDDESVEQAEKFAATFAELRKKKGITLDDARETMKDISYYATMMIYDGQADGMVSGAAHTTAHTIRPALQIIKTAPGSSVVSSIFLMVMRGKLWAFGDCAVNPNPTSEQLAEIAVTSADTAASFGIDPRVALLSYSTGSSGAGDDVDKVTRAVELAQSKAADAPRNGSPIAIDGPIQFDAAVEPSVGKKKMPDSDVAGQATVFVFPTLDAGNIAYKAVQRTANALAVGPVLQGLNKPVNDLSRGATVPDIINTVAVTAVQVAAQTSTHDSAQS